MKVDHHEIKSDLLAEYDFTNARPNPYIGKFPAVIDEKHNIFDDDFVQAESDVSETELPDSTQGRHWKALP